MPSLRCLVSALTQAGGGDLLFWFASAVQSCYVEGGRCRQISLCVGSTHCVPATLGLPRTGVSVLPICTAQAPSCSIWSRPCIACGSRFQVPHKSADSVAPAFCAFPGLSGSSSQRLGRTLPGCGAPCPSAAPARAAGPVSGSLQTGTGVCLPGGRGWLLWG